jgi:predicted RNA-binding Zn-ribbon protein involved in translation (DUF1610 family)
MATMEHFCSKCGWSTCNNSSGPFVCPKCGEELGHASDDDYEDDDE